MLDIWISCVNSRTDIQYTKTQSNLLNRVTKLVQGCSKLKSINLASCTQLKGPFLHSIAQSCVGLVDLNLFCVHAIQDDMLSELAQHCALLESVDLSWCFNLTLEGLLECLQLGKSLCKVCLLGLDPTICGPVAQVLKIRVRTCAFQQMDYSPKLSPVSTSTVASTTKARLQRARQDSLTMDDSKMWFIVFHLCAITYPLTPTYL